VHHLFDPAFADKFRKIVEGRYKRYGHFEYDTEGEIERYKVRFLGRFGSHALAHASLVSCLSKTPLFFYY
jgi:hypothetical protein